MRSLFLSICFAFMLLVANATSMGDDFSTIDADNNNEVTADEFTAWVLSTQGPEISAESAAVFAAEFIKYTDKNGDGIIQWTEGQEF